MLAKSGNPTMDHLSAVLGAIKTTLRVNIRAVVKAAWRWIVVSYF
jgi:hypothetical protein